MNDHDKTSAGAAGAQRSADPNADPNANTEADANAGGEVPESAEAWSSGEVASGDGAEGEGTGAVAEEELDPIAALEGEVLKWKDLALRGQADLENFRKRMTRDRQDALRYANSGLLEALLPILDNFEMGLEAARAESEDSMIFQGMNMVLNQVHGFLQDQGVTEVEAVGKAFDPKEHEAMVQEPSDAVPEGDIIRVMRRGYRLRDRLLRAPAVVVSTGAAKSGAEAEAPVDGADSGE